MPEVTKFTPQLIEGLKLSGLFDVYNGDRGIYCSIAATELTKASDSARPDIYMKLSALGSTGPVASLFKAIVVEAMDTIWGTAWLIEKRFKVPAYQKATDYRNDTQSLPDPTITLLASPETVNEVYEPWKRHTDRESVKAMTHEVFRLERELWKFRCGVLTRHADGHIGFWTNMHSNINCFYVLIPAASNFKVIA